MNIFDFNIVKNPTVFQENRLPAHSDHRWYLTREEASRGENGQILSLNGIWYFHYAKNPALAPQGFERADFRVEGWDRIRVPAHLQMEGYDVPQYANTQYPWEGRNEVAKGEIPMDFNPTASYVTFFALPKTWNRDRIILQFDGAESGFALWCNGSYVGYSEDSFTPSAFDITPYLCDGENRIALRVFKWTAGSWCEDQDFYRFSGIFRDVFLYSEPEMHLRDLKIRTAFAEDPEKGTDYSKAELSLEAAVTKPCEIRVTLSRANASIWKEEWNTEQSGSTAEAYSDNKEQNADAPILLKKVIEVNAPDLWSAEIPVLYDLELELLDGNGEVREIVREKVGFRKFELDHGIMKINGKRIIFKGANRHEFSSETGRVMSDSDIRKDLITMKRNNINAVRTSHYPNKTSFYRMCDELGLYVIDETNLETHGCWDAFCREVISSEEIIPNNWPQYRDLILDRAVSMYERDKNHPSILIWSCGNESWGGKNLLDMSNLFRKLDPTRLVHYEGVDHDPTYMDTTDIYSSMYTPVEEIKEKIRLTDKPYICVEYAHAMGNSCGALEKYTTYAETEERYQGGFIWDFIDQSITAKTRYGETYQAYGGDLGDRPHDASFCGNGIVYGGAERKTSPKMQEVKYDYQGFHIRIQGDEVIIRNSNLFRNSRDYEVVLILKKEGRLLKQVTVQTDIEPQQEGVIPLPFPVPDDSEYSVEVSVRLKEETAWAEAGYEVAFGQETFGRMDYSQFMNPERYAGHFEIKHGYANVGISGTNFEAIFSLIHGGLVSYKYCGREMLPDMPRPNFWRPMTENDIACQLPARAGQWKIASTYLSAKYEHGRRANYPAIIEQEDHVTVVYTYPLLTTPSVNCVMSYTVYADGTMHVQLEMEPSAAVGTLPEFGALFTLDADYDRIMWYGRGPEETYWDRNHAKIDVYEERVEDGMAKYLRPSECGNKCDVRYASVTDRRGRGMLFWGDAFNFSALPYSPDMIDYAQHDYELPKVYKTWIRISALQMGVGGDDTWGAMTHPEYVPDNSKKLTFDFYCRGI